MTWVLLYHTKFGRYVFAIGGNRQALVLAGTRVPFWHIAVYVYAGVLTALASFIMTARMNAAHPTIGVGLEFDAIAAVILGGTSFEKGRGGSRVRSSVRWPSAFCAMGSTCSASGPNGRLLLSAWSSSRRWASTHGGD